MNVVLHEFILDPGEIIAKDQPNQKLASLAKIYDLLPQREHLPKQGTMYCRMKMQQVLEIILALKHANKQEEIDAEYILELLEKLMQSLSASRKSLQQGGFQQDIYTNKESYGGIDPEHENRLLESEKVALKFFNMQKMLFLQRVHFAVKNQSQSLSMERKVLQLESIANSFKEHLDKDSFQEVSSRAASLYQTKNGKKELKPQNDVLQIMAIPTGDPLFIYNNVQLVIQQLERALIPPPPKPVSLESNDNDYGCIVFTKPKTKRKRKQVAPEVKDEIRALCLANKNSSIKKIKSLSPDVLGKFSDEQIRVSNVVIAPSLLHVPISYIIFYLSLYSLATDEDS